MFGKEWVPGRARIVASKNIPRNQWSSSEEFVADVQPDGGGPVFRAVFRGPQSDTGFVAPGVGEVIRVLCDPKHEKAKLDLDDPSPYLTARAAERATFDEARHGAAMSVPMSSAAPSPPIDADMHAAEASFRAALGRGQADMEAFHRAKQSGDTSAMAELKAAIAAGNVEVQGLNAEIQRLNALRSGARGPVSPTADSPSVAAAMSVAQSDSLDHLQKLADLHDRGALTDAEFAAAKAKILGAP